MYVCCFQDLEDELQKLRRYDKILKNDYRLKFFCKIEEIILAYQVISILI